MSTQTVGRTRGQTLAGMALGARGSAGQVAARRHADGAWQRVSYDELGSTACEVANGLIALGVEPGARVAVLSQTRYEWTMADLAILAARAVVTPVYPTNSPSECQYVLEHSGAQVVFCEDEEQVAKIREIRARCPELAHVITFGDAVEGAELTLAELRERGREVDAAELERRAEAVTADDPATIVYTSGTTGPPKGCVLSHGNITSACDMANEVLDIRAGESFYLFLPLSHVFARVVQMLALRQGGELVFWRGDTTMIVQDVAETNPVHLAAVPRIFEKIHTTATSKAAEAGGAKAKLFTWAIGVGRGVRAAERAGRSPNPLLRAQHALADKLVLSRIRGLFGTQMRIAITGAAPIDPEILEFFDAAGVTIIEGFGMTETASVAMVNPPKAARFGTVGPPLPGSEAKIADDGELLLRGPNIFGGYFRNPEATRETLVDGWLHTGDLAEIDEQGYVRIVGRKKDIIVTSSGKNITPSNIENALRNNRWISQAIIIGDRRQYLVALITLDETETDALAAAIGASGKSAAELARDDRVRAEIQRAVDEVNREFARIEQIKRFAILEHDLTQATGELTPTLKVKRNVVNERFADVIDALYDAPREG